MDANNWYGRKIAANLYSHSHSEQQVQHNHVTNPFQPQDHNHHYYHQHYQHHPHHQHYQSQQHHPGHQHHLHHHHQHHQLYHQVDLEQHQQQQLQLHHPQLIQQEHQQTQLKEELDQENEDDGEEEEEENFQLTASEHSQPLDRDQQHQEQPSATSSSSHGLENLEADCEDTSTFIVVTDPKSGRSVHLTNEQLIGYSARQLNKTVAGFPPTIIKKLKQRRRRLKNRGYAQNCRHKRLDHKIKLERQNDELRSQNEDQKQIICELRREIHQLRVQLGHLPI